MLVDVTKLKSHPDKPLFTHVDGVISNVKKLTENFEVGKWAELVAIFHDLGKINPNFQDKLNPKKKTEGYGNHAYFSAYAFFCAFRYNQPNFKMLKKWLKVEKLSEDTLIALTVIIAKHHGHLLDLKPEDDSADKRILNSQELGNLYSFLNERKDELPMIEFSKYYLKETEAFKPITLDERYQKHFLDKFIFDSKLSETSLDFFLNVQFAFASLIYSDKSDAAKFVTIDESKKEVTEFCKIYQNQLNNFLETLKPDSKLNVLRTAIRKEAVLNIGNHLKKDKRVFELTSPTGSGKTLMLLSLAAKIIEEKGDYRIMYALPFLSITEQVEAEVLKIFKAYEDKNFIQRIDSKSINLKFEEIQKALDDTPSEANIRKLGALTFQENVFAYPFVITTFVRFFETLLSNHNATLLKLPNFSKSIFLLDEIQSLPPRLYTFFVAYLERFCEKFDSYAVISTATQPNFNLPSKPFKEAEKAKTFFPNYEYPSSLIEHEKYFSNDVFNRYKVHFRDEEVNLEKLKELVLGESNSVLVILNTIDDSKDFYKILNEELSKDELILLNTHFTPNDRKRKIAVIKGRLKTEKRIITISTQLIEAGVDIDFPILYRDFAPVSSIVQSAGRCNRNGKLDFGKVVLFKLRNRGKIRSELIYGRGKDKDILQFTKDAWGKFNYEEKELLSVQKNFFDRILNELHFAKHTQNKFDLKLDFIQDMSDCMFRKIGKFQLIDEIDYGEPMRYYVPEDNQDINFETLLELGKSMASILGEQKKDYNKISPLKGKIESLLKNMSGNIVQVRLKKKDSKPLVDIDDYFGLHKIDLDYYSKDLGILVDDVVGII
jgi:CRISPR-associated endonuclease/helicase Cas3